MGKKRVALIIVFVSVFLSSCSNLDTSSFSKINPSSSVSSEPSSSSSAPSSLSNSYEYKVFNDFKLSEKVVSFSADGSSSLDNEWASFLINKGKTGTFFSLEKGGSFTNETPLTYVSGIEINYTRSSEYGQLYYSVSDYPISSPNASILPIYSGTKIAFDNGGYPFFSIYAAVGEFDIESISVFSTERRSERDTSDIDVYSVNDLHGAIEYNVSSAMQIGASRMSSYFARESQKNINGSIILSSGDMWQGSADSNMSEGKLVNEWMNMVGFESMALGNHEFDWNPSTIEKNAKEANFPFLCINLRNENDEMPSWVSPSKIIARQGIKIGIIGAIGLLESSIEANALSGYHFSPSYITLINKEATRLREKEGCSLIFLSYHNERFDTSSCRNIDAVFEGHTHTGYSRIDEYGIPHVQCYGNGSGIQHLKFKRMDDGSYKYSAEESDMFSYSSASSLLINAPFEELNAYFEEKIAPIKNKVVGTSDKPLSKDDIGAIGSEALYRYAEDNYPEYEVAASFINTGGVRQTIPSGEVTYGQIYASLPFDNTNNICSIGGRELKSQFLNNGGYYYSYCEGNVSSIEDNKEYNVITLSFISDGKYGKSLTVLKRDGNYLRNIVADYFKEVTENA